MSEVVSKRCSKCGKTKLLEMYPPIGRGRRANTCRICWRAGRRIYDAVHRKKPHVRAARAEHSRTHRRARQYGLTVDQLSRLIDSVRSCCQICGRFVEGRDQHIDHDHVTGVVRGVLCVQHNTGLGKFQDSPEMLEAGADYLRRFKNVGSNANVYADSYAC